MYEIDVWVFSQTFEQRACTIEAAVLVFHVSKGVPTHAGHLVLMAFWTEALHFCIEYADAVDVTLFRVAAQQLLSDANAQNRLTQIPDDLV